MNTLYNVVELNIFSFEINDCAELFVFKQPLNEILLNVANVH